MPTLIRKPKSRVTALLGPTNTGKTHFAVERMLGYRSGIIGLPLRLLAREIYDRAAALKGAGAAALITGEERVVPPTARYFVCTVESMPVSRPAEFVAVDEIQVAADPERGHVFTDRLLSARGSFETLFMGANTARRLIRHLVPGTEIVTRPRFSRLTFAGAKKLSRLPPRSAIVAFSASDVYAIAEFIRRARGGAAVVMGSLSPRTRNAQVALFEEGEVDFLVATDAIGMGLNLNVGHVAFAGLSKFDGRRTRPLTAAEIGQIAGRAGRHMNDGTFGTTGEAPDLDGDTVAQIEAHQYQGLRRLQYRNTKLDLSSVPGLITSLEMPVPDSCLVRAQDSDDLMALKGLFREDDIARAVRSPANVRLLWDVCRIPDFRKTLPDTHVQLLARLFRHLLEEGRIPADWLAAQVARLDQVDGGIDTLSQRLGFIRTWTYVTHRESWLDDPVHWQERTRAVEDRLSDALHRSLTQRFVDARTSALRRKLRDAGEWHATVTEEGEVRVEGHDLGHLKGFRFVAADVSTLPEGRALRAAARPAIHREIMERARTLSEAADTALRLTPEGRILWQGEAVARLEAGNAALTPRLSLVHADLLSGRPRVLVRKRLERWLDSHIEYTLGPLVRLSRADLVGAARGLAYHLEEGLGSVRAGHVQDLVAALQRDEASRLSRLGVRFGRVFVYMPPLLKPARANLRLILWGIHRNAPALPLEAAGRVSVPAAEAPPGFYEAAGYAVCGARAVRIDMLERLAAEAAKLSRVGAFTASPELLSLAGCTRDEFPAVLKVMGFRVVSRDPDGEARYATRKPARVRGRTAGPGSAKLPEQKPDAAAPASDSPFAVLRALDFAPRRGRGKPRRRKSPAGPRKRSRPA